MNTGQDNLILVKIKEERSYMSNTTIPQITTPHNNLFFQVLSRKEKAIPFFEKYLQKPILKAATNLDQIELAESKHMSDGGISLYNDILYRCPLGKDQLGYFFIMCEHQSTPDPNMPLRLMEYNVATIRGHLKQGHKKYPVIVNTVLYTGNPPWNYSTDFNDYYANPSLGSQYLTIAPFNLVQLPENTHESIYIDKDLGFCFAAFYCGRSRDPYVELEKFKQIPAFKNYFNGLSIEERVLFGRYIALCVDRNRYTLEKIVNLMIINEQEKEKFMRSVAQEYIEQGILIKAREVAKNMLLKLRLDMDTVQKATELTKEELQQILKEEKI